jgi:hypothetical protein
MVTNQLQAIGDAMSKGRMIFGLMCVLLPAMAGCGNGLATVSGTVTLDGQPAGGPDRYAAVNFSRESGGGAPAVGIVDESGHYTLKTGAQDGLEPGNYSVAISVQKVTPPKSQDAMPQLTLISPAKYSRAAESGLRKEVKPGRNAIDFALSSKGT